jgi:hypothetical protein
MQNVSLAVAPAPEAVPRPSREQNHCRQGANRHCGKLVVNTKQWKSNGREQKREQEQETTDPFLVAGQNWSRAFTR